MSRVQIGHSLRCFVALLLAVAHAAASAATLAVRVADGAGRPVEHAVVYAVSPAAEQQSARGRSAVVNQIDREFAPLVTAVQTGTAVRFPNKDPMLHHVYSFSPAKQFQIKLNADTATTSIVFDKPGVVALGCNIHDWMEAYILVVESPYFAQTDGKGAAQIANLPRGEYELHVWHPYQRAGVAAQPLSVNANRRFEAAFSLEVNVPRRKPKPPLEKDSY